MVIGRWVRRTPSVICFYIVVYGRTCSFEKHDLKRKFIQTGVNDEVMNFGGGKKTDKGTFQCEQGGRN